MKKKDLILFFSFMMMTFSLLSQQRLNITMKNVLPTSNGDECVIDHKNYMELYSPIEKQSVCVAYLLTKEMVQHPIYKRINAFKKDPLIKKDYSLPSDYNHSGYDKGHLCPCEDMRWDSNAMLSTFYMSNMSPQIPTFNRCDWKKLEEMTRHYAIANDSIIVVVMPIFDGSSKCIGTDNVVVPTAFCRIVIDVSYPTYKAIAFIMVNDSVVGRDIYKCAMSVTASEKIIKRFLFGTEKDKTQFEQLLENVCISDWKK